MTNVWKIIKGLLCLVAIVMLLGIAGWIGTHFSLSAVWSFLSSNIVGILTGMAFLLICWLLGTLMEKCFPSRDSKKGGMPKMPKK